MKRQTIMDENDVQPTIIDYRTRRDIYTSMPLHRIPKLSSQRRNGIMLQRRPFLGLHRPPAPKPHLMGYLVAQGLAVVLLADLAFATLTNEPTTIRAICQTVGLWKEPPKFEQIHYDTKPEGIEE